MKAWLPLCVIYYLLPSVCSKGIPWLSPNENFQIMVHMWLGNAILGIKDMCEYHAFCGAGEGASLSTAQQCCNSEKMWRVHVNLSGDTRLEFLFQSWRCSKLLRKHASLACDRRILATRPPTAPSASQGAYSFVGNRPSVSASRGSKTGLQLHPFF